MTPLPPPLGDGALVGWRIEEARFAAAWNRGEGAFRFGGRWNSAGVRVVYAALDPATSILEVAAHRGFDALDLVPHVLTAFRFDDVAGIRVVMPGDLPGATWLSSGRPGPDQQRFGDGLTARHGAVLVPSAVSRHSWNIVAAADGARFELVAQEPFVLDRRLHPRGTVA